MDGPDSTIIDAKEPTKNGNTSIIKAIPIKFSPNKISKRSKKLHLLQLSLFVRLVTAVIFGLISYNLRYFIEPTRRGFWCSDKSIRFPYHDSTISSNTVFLVCIPIICLLTVIGEICFLPKNPVGRNDMPLESIWMIGLAVNFFLLNTIKLSLGSLRPNFIDVCKPAIVGSGPPEMRWDTCQNITDFYFPPHYRCTTEVENNPATKYKIFDAKLSFYSGHSSLSFFLATYIILYTHMRIERRSPEMFLPFFILFYSIMASFAGIVAVSRIYDHKHHPIDVIVGTGVGIFIGILTVYLHKNIFTEKEEIQMVSATKVSSTPTQSNTTENTESTRV